MNVCVSTTGLMQRLQFVSWALAVSFFALQQVAHAAPVVVSVDHRVSVTYSNVQFDARKGVYSTQVRIKNRSAVALLAPLRLRLQQFESKNVRPLNAIRDGKDGQPYFEFALPKGILAAGSVTVPVKILFAVDKSKDVGTTKEQVHFKARLPAFTYHVSAGVELALLRPNASPADLSANSGKKTVSFSVPLVGKFKPTATVYLRRSGDKQIIAMNDLGKDGDVTASDGTWGVDVQIDTAKVKPDTCMQYEAFIKQERAELASPLVKLCVSSFPVKMAEPDITSPAVFPDGSTAVADEILLTVSPATTAAAIRKLADSIHANVVGSYMTLDLYQLKLPARLNANQLLEIASQLEARPGVVSAFINAIGQFAVHIDDPEFSVQHGLKLVVEHDVHGVDTNAWDAGATGNGVTVVVLDSGLDRTHPDFVSAGNCQLTTDAASGVAVTGCGGTNDDSAGHGTQVAGVLAAKTNNTKGMAGVAFGSKIHAEKVSPNANVVWSQMLTGFTLARDYISGHPMEASVVNASFSAAGASAIAANWKQVCDMVEQVVYNGQARAVVVNAVGNNNINGYYYPARCKGFTFTHPTDPSLNYSYSQPELLIAVSSSTSGGGACGADDQREPSSNFGAWVDIAAPGCNILTTANGAQPPAGNYATVTGNSFAAPLVAGAAAMLRSCNVPPGQIKSTLVSSANVDVLYPDSLNPTGSTPRLDIYRALSYQAATEIALSSSSINENNMSGALVGTLGATDLDPCDRFTFALVAGTGDTDNGAFSITGNSLTINSAADFETTMSYNIRVQVTDFGGATFDQPLTVIVSNVNEAPTAINLSASSIDENNAAGATVATLTATDPDSIASGYASPFTFELVAGAGDTGNGAFTITGNTLTINNAADFEATPSYSIRIRVTDNGGLSYETTKTVTINNRNDAPIAINLSASSIDENNAAGATVATLTATDPDSIASGYASPFTFELVAGAGDTGNGAFTITGNTLTINNAADFEATPSYSIRIRVTDNGGLSYETTKTVTINNRNDAPSIVGPLSFTHIEFNQIANAWPFGVDDFVGIVNASDPDGDTLTYSIDPAGNSADINGVPQQNAFKFDAAIPGRLMVDNRLAVNFEYKPVFNLPVQVTDADGLSASANVTVTLTNDANDNGDPHITTVRGLRYDFQSAGEFVALRGAKGMEIQTRQTPIPGPAPFADPYSGLAVGVSINTAVAARVGDYRVTYQPNASGVPELRINGDVTTLPANGIDLGGGGRVAPLGANGIHVDFPDGTAMTVTAYLWGSLSYMQIDVMHTTAREGLMGINTAGSWLPRLADGTSFGAMPSALCDRFVELYEKFADSWRVTDDTSLFDYDDDPVTSTSTFTSVWPLEKPLCAAPSIAAATPRPTTVAVAAPVRRIAPVAPRGIVLKPVAKQVAQQHCRTIAGKNEKANCIFDVMFTGNTGFARAYQRTEKLRAGLTSVVVRTEDKLNAKGELVVTATVARHAMVVPKVKGVRAVPAGAVQFMLGDKPLGKPVKLDAKGQAKLVVTRQNMERFNAGKLAITAQYQPARDKANVFLPSVSRKLTGKVVAVDPKIRGVR